MNTPKIPPAAIGAAAQADHDYMARELGYMKWADLPTTHENGWKKTVRDGMRVALEAAMPHLIAEFRERLIKVLEHTYSATHHEIADAVFGAPEVRESAAVAPLGSEPTEWQPMCYACGDPHILADHYSDTSERVPEVGGER